MHHSNIASCLPSRLNKTFCLNLHLNIPPVTSCYSIIVLVQMTAMSLTTCKPIPAICFALFLLFHLDSVISLLIALCLVVPPALVIVPRDRPMNAWLVIVPRDQPRNALLVIAPRLCPALTLCCGATLAPSRFRKPGRATPAQ